MKKLIVLLAMLISGIALSQPTYLMIFENENDTNRITYPPGTPYELRDEDNNLILNETNYSGEFKIDKSYILTVRPSWTEKLQIYNLTSGKLVIAQTTKYTDNPKKSKTKKKYQSYGVTLDEKVLTDSETIDNQKNVRLTFSDGVVFTYTDGEARAYKNGDELRIEYKYLIYSDMGIHKVSFNPKNGKVYWVFDPE